MQPVRSFALGAAFALCCAFPALAQQPGVGETEEPPAPAWKLPSLTDPEPDTTEDERFPLKAPDRPLNQARIPLDPGASLPLPEIDLPGISGYAAPSIESPLDIPGGGEVTLAARLTAEGGTIPRGLTWRVFLPQPGPDGKLPLVATAQGGTSTFQLKPGSYLIHAAFGRAGATKRVTIGEEPRNETFVLDAGGLLLNAELSGGVAIPPEKLRFSIYEAGEDEEGDRVLVVPNVSANSVIRLSAGTYQVVSTYGKVNAVIRSDIRVQAGKLTEATIEHRAAELTMKLVREPGGEAIADTAWSILTDSGDIVRESVGAFASMVLAEGTYIAVAKNRDQLYQREFSVVPGRNQDVELIVKRDAAPVQGG